MFNQLRLARQRALSADVGIVRKAGGRPLQACTLASLPARPSATHPSAMRAYPISCTMRSASSTTLPTPDSPAQVGTVPTPQPPFHPFSLRPPPPASRAAQVHGSAGIAALGPLASLDDEQEVNDTLGQLLMVMQILDDEIGEGPA